MVKKKNERKEKDPEITILICGFVKVGSIVFSFVCACLKLHIIEHGHFLSFICTTCIEW